MNINTLKNLLPNDELFLLEDLPLPELDKFKDVTENLNDYQYLLISQYYPETIEILNNNNIKYKFCTDEFDHDYIII